MSPIAEPKKTTFTARYARRQQDKEYTGTYLNRKRGRKEKPNSYPITRLILIKDFFRTPDLYKAIGFFISAQLGIMAVSEGTKHPELAGALNLIGLLIGVVLIVLAVRTINARQKYDETRRRFQLSHVIVIAAVMLMAVYAVTIIFHALGVHMPEQPNQESLDALLKRFPLAMMFTMIIVSPIIEETVFRELLPYATGPSYLSFAISSLIFIALHAPYGIMGWTSYGILATGFLYARLKDNNVYTGIGVHMIWNILSLIM